MTIWDTLGISQTNDINTIKAAYAAKAKEFHPEEHPTEFQHLQKCYKQALRIAKSQQAKLSTTSPAYIAPPVTAVKTPETKPLTEKTSEEKPPETPVETPVKKPTVVPIIVQTSDEKPAQDVPSTQEEEASFSFNYTEIQEASVIPRFFKELELIIQNPFLQNRISCWKFFFHQPLYSNLFANSDFRMTLLEQILAHSGWTQDTLSFFLKYISEELAANPKLNQRFTALWNKNVTSAQPTKEQRELHLLHLHHIGVSYADTTFDSPKNLAAYLESYFKYPSIPKAVKEAKDIQKKKQQEYNRQTPAPQKVSTSLIVIFVIGFLLRLFVHLNDKQDSSNEIPNWQSYQTYSSNYGSTTETHRRNTPSPTPFEVKQKLTLEDIPSQKFGQLLQSVIPSGTVASDHIFYTTEELAQLEIAPVFQEVLSGNFTNIQGSYENSSIVVPFDESGLELLTQEYENRVSWQFCLLDINGDQTKELCIRNEYGQLGYVIASSDGLQGTLYNWTLYSSKKDYYSSFYEDGQENYIPLADGCCLHLKVKYDAAENIFIDLYIEQCLPDGSTEVMQKLILQVMNNYDFYIAEHTPIKPSGSFSIRLENPFLYYRIDLAASDAIKLTQEEFDTWLDENIFHNWISDHTWYSLPTAQ